MSEKTVGRILSIALRTRPKGPMREVQRATAIENGGLQGDVAVRPDRGITFLASAQWTEVTQLLGADLPWHTRRANVLVDAPSLAGWIGKTIAVGAIQVRINAESKPCNLMDRLHPGLREALLPDARGGVYGRILRGGAIHVGDEIVFGE